MPSTTTKNICWFVFQNDRLLLATPGDANRLVFSELVVGIESAIVRQYQLTTFDAYDIFCAELSNDYQLPSTMEAVPLRKALEILGQDWYTIAVKAYMIITWDKNHQFCGRCGSDTTHRTGTFERICSLCEITFYPRISPSIIVCITNQDRILMARSYHFPAGVYGMIAGFVEPGESVEDAVHREVLEEVGITVSNLEYFGSQAWPFPDSLMIAFTGKYSTGEIDINNDEIEAAGWYRYDELPGRPSSSVSISGKLLDYSITRLQTEFE